MNIKSAKRCVYLGGGAALLQLLSMSVSAQSCTAPVIGHGNSAPVIDGQVDALWANVPSSEINNVTLGSRPADYSGKWRALSTSDNLYILVEVGDSTVVNDSGSSWWDDDTVEIFIDANNSKNSSYDGVNDFQFGFRWNDNTVKVGGNSVNNTAGIVQAKYRTVTGYNLEVAIPWSTLGVTPQLNTNIGLDIAIDDDDNGGARDAQMTWFATSGAGFSNPSVFGTVPLRTCVTSSSHSSSTTAASYRIINRWTNTYLCDTGNNVTYATSSSGTACQWVRESIAGGYSAFRNLASGDYMHIENLSGTVQAAGGDASWWSANWAVSAVDATYSLIQNRWQATQYIHVENQTGSAQSGVIDTGWWSAQWKLEAVGGTGASSSPSSIAASSVAPSSTPASSIPASSVPASSIAPSSFSSSSVAPSSVSSSSSSSSIGATITYQAEDNFYSGGVTNAGTYLQNFVAQGARAIVAVNTNNAGNYNVSLRYANGSGSDKTLSVYVNGLKALTTTLAPTGGNTTWANKVESLALRAGFNSISYQYDAGNTGGVNIDSVSIPGGAAMATRGATLSYQTYEAEHATTNGQVSAYGTSFPSVESESSGRQFVALNSTGHYVQWTASKAANTLVVRYNMPEAPNGGGTSNTLSLYVNGAKVKTLDLSSHFAWTYGGYPFNNDHPSGGGGHHFYDDSQFTGLNIPAGATVKLQRDATDTAAFYKIDFIELEYIDAAYTMPANFISITSQGATANDGTDDTQAIINTINYAKQTGMGVWIPAGTFNINARINDLNNVHIRGAGMWHTRLQGSNGQGGFYANGSNVTIADMTIASDSYYRDNGGHTAAIEGDFGTGSLVQNIWVEHMKVGVWLKPNTDGLLITNGRIRNTWADGVNFHAGVKNSTISHFNVRNNGDDSFAMWSQPGSININNSFRFNTAQLPILANTYAIYGGQDNKVLDNIGEDTVRASAGIAISTRGDFPGGTAPFTGTTEVKRNTLNRTGGWEPNWNTSFGGLWIYADGQSITAPIVVDNLTLNNSLYEAILLSYNQQITNLSFNNIQINGAGTYGLHFSGVTGSGTFNNVTVTGTGSAALQNPNNQFTVVRGSGNSGW